MNREKEFIDALAELSADGRRNIEVGNVSAWIDQNTKRGTNLRWDVLARQVLRTLAEVGLVEHGAYNGIVLTDAFFDSAPSKTARAKRQANNNQRRPPPPGDGEPSDPDDLGGGGFREVLSHPFLFALSDEDFDELLDTI